MGYLDSFLPQNLQGFGGLLDHLPMWRMQPGASNGFPDDQLPANAKPTNGPLPAPMNIVPPQPQAEPGMGDRLMAGFQGFARGGGLLPALAGAAEGLSTGQTPKNMTIQTLMQRGLDENMARTVASDPGLLRSVLPQIMGIGGQTDDIKEYQFAKQQGFTGSLEQWMQRKRAGAGEYALQPIYGQDKDGNTVILQLGKSGEAVQSKMPANVKINAGVDKIDLGTQWGIMDKRSGQIVGYQPKDIAGKEAAEERGKAVGQAQANLPKIISGAEQTLKIIDSVQNDPYRERGTGLSSVFNAIPATGGFDFAQKVKQLQGKSFLQAYQDLKGGGAITEIEGQKAENAVARLNVAQSEEAFNEALNELREIVTAGIERARRMAGGDLTAPSSAPPSASPSAPAAPVSKPSGKTKSGVSWSVD
jgi:hypothetical protein